MSPEVKRPTAEERAAALVKNAGEPGVCRGCHSAIAWIRHSNGKATPYDADGTNHFITCEARAAFKRLHARTAAREARGVQGTHTP